MTDEELERPLADVESDRSERKQSLADPDKVRQAICAFANDLPNHGAPGVLLIGAKDDGSCAGLAITDELLRTLADMRQDIVPFPSITVQKRSLNHCEIAVVLVEPSDAPPVRYKGRVWVRVGPRRAIATPEEERRLTEKRRSGDLPFDIRPMRHATTGDLDLELFRNTYLRASVAAEVIEQNQRTVEQQLASLRLAVGEASQAIPTVLGVLVLGRDPMAQIPGAYVQFLRFDGTELADPVRDSAAISGPLPELIRMAEERLVAHIETARDFISGAVDVAHAAYPIVAIQQLARNAIMHRSYEGTNAPVRINWFSDRIEILSPGGPYGQVTEAYRDFEALARTIAARIGLSIVTDYRRPRPELQIDPK
ncbi:MAG TPA: RNA-binding domain-containing protein [Candidatus Acidoferrales bacterium]|jgi:ATP-dependent DNA helicase RecG|nr:RNA-binding domain-containing protein [Candidatus Acidoferrales bacterium]